MGHYIIFDADDLGVTEDDTYEYVVDTIHTLCHHFVTKHSEFIGVKFSDGSVFKVKCRQTGQTDFKREQKS